MEVHGAGGGGRCGSAGGGAPQNESCVNVGRELFYGKPVGPFGLLNSLAPGGREAEPIDGCDREAEPIDGCDREAEPIEG